MRKIRLGMLAGLLIVVLTPNIVAAAKAQEKAMTQNAVQSGGEQPPLSIYRVEFAVKETAQGKVLNTRAYTMLVDPSGEWSRIRVGNRVPYATGANQFQYQDVGMRIDCHFRREQAGYAVLDTTVQITGVAESRTVGPVTSNPIFRNAQSEETTAVELGKPTIISTLGDVSSDHTYEIEVTATKVK